MNTDHVQYIRHYGYRAVMTQHCCQFSVKCWTWCWTVSSSFSMPPTMASRCRSWRRAVSCRTWEMHSHCTHRPRIHSLRPSYRHRQRKVTATTIYSYAEKVEVTDCIGVLLYAVTAPMENGEVESLGEVSVEVTLTRHPATDDKKITVKGSWYTATFMSWLL